MAEKSPTLDTTPHGIAPRYRSPGKPVCASFVAQHFQERQAFPVSGSAAVFALNPQSMPGKIVE
jgi:hypothetical protein